MKLLSKRFKYGDTYTISKLYIDDVYECYILEDKVREPGIKIPGETAIPAGIYKLVITWSIRFKRYLPLLLNVPGFEGIRIHTGNKAEDTEGCLLVGQRLGDSTVGDSRLAFTLLFDKLQDAILHKKEEVTIEIVNI